MTKKDATIIGILLVICFFAVGLFASFFIVS
jgi:hypothetical protein